MYGFGEEAVIAETDVLKFIMRTGMSFGFLIFKKRTYNQERKGIS